MNADNLTNRWLAVLGIGAVIFGLALFTLRVPVRTMIIFFAIGIPVVFLWLYADERSRKEKRDGGVWKDTTATMHLLCL